MINQTNERQHYKVEYYNYCEAASFISRIGTVQDNGMAENTVPTLQITVSWVANDSGWGQFC